MIVSETQITVDGTTYFVDDKIKSNISEFYNLNDAKVTKSVLANDYKAQIHFVEEKDRKGVLIINEPSTRKTTMINQQI